MRREPDFFGDQELILIHGARRLKAALALERSLDDAALDYAVIPAPYSSGLLFYSQRVGAFFYVAAQDADRARKIVLSCGFKPIQGSSTEF